MTVNDLQLNMESVNIVNLFFDYKLSIMTIWFNRKFNGIKRYCSKSISFSFTAKNWKLISANTNGALKGRKEDTCYDCNIHFFGVKLSYTNWDYNS